MTRFADAAAGGEQNTVTGSRLVGATGALLGVAAAIAMGDPGLDLARREACIGAEIAVIRSPRHFSGRMRGALLAGTGRGQIDSTLARPPEVPGEDTVGEVWEVWAAFARYPDDVH